MANAIHLLIYYFSNIMLNLNGTLTVIDAVQSGTSKSTGRPWINQGVVIMHKDFEGTEHTLAMKAISQETVDALKQLSIGDEVNFSVGIAATAREWKDADGFVHTLRGNDMYMHHIEKKTI